LDGAARGSSWASAVGPVATQHRRAPRCLRSSRPIAAVPSRHDRVHEVRRCVTRRLPAPHAPCGIAHWLLPRPSTTAVSATSSSRHNSCLVRSSNLPSGGPGLATASFGSAELLCTRPTSQPTGQTSCNGADATASVSLRACRGRQRSFGTHLPSLAHQTARCFVATWSPADSRHSTGGGAPEDSHRPRCKRVKGPWSSLHGCRF